MKFLSAIILLFVTLNSCAQTSPVWSLENVPYPNTNSIAGYIYQIYAIGILYDKPFKKDITALRLICSTRGDIDPIIAIYWNLSTGLNLVEDGQYINIKIDDHNFDERFLWKQDDTLTYRHINDSKNLIDAMKTGHYISFDWIDVTGKRRHTKFDLSGFNVQLNDFNTACKLSK